MDMQTKVDVLAVMELVAHEVDWHSNLRAAQLRDALAAVADLIEASHAMYERAEFEGFARDAAPEMAALDAALTRVGAAA
jgi:hypothetical protein